MNTTLWIAGLFLLAGALAAQAGSSPPAATLEVTVQKLEVTSITDETGDILESHMEQVPSGGTLQFTYTDPTDGHEFDLAFRLQAGEPERSAGSPVAIEYRWLDRTTGETRDEERGFAVEGTFSVSLYRLPERQREVIVRLRPRVETAEAPAR